MLRQSVVAGACALASLCTLNTSATAQIDARVPALFAHRNRTGGTVGFYRPSPSFESSGLAPLILRYRRTPTSAELAKYQVLGLRTHNTLASGAVRVEASEPALHAMLKDGVLERASVDLPPAILLHPLEEARKEMSIDASLATWRAQNHSDLTGKGVIVGDLDASADPYHPAFFKPLPSVAWVDVDGDGVLTAGVDGVDRDSNGKIDANEVLKLLDGKAKPMFASDGKIAGTDDTGFNPGWDYLYLDSDGDGRRNYGPLLDGSDAMPGLGEPLYAGEDANGDGKIQITERLVPLGDSKFLAIRSLGKEYKRGAGLASYESVSSIDNSSHGTQTLGTILGGQWGISRFLGLAPEAEVVLATDIGSESLTDKLDWLAAQGATIIVPEESYWGQEPSDGSTEFELLLDSLVDKGIVVVTPAGNLGNSTKHTFATIPPAAQPSYQNEWVLAGTGTPTKIWLSITWREGATAIAGAINFPDSDTIVLDADEPSGKTALGRTYTVVHGTTAKNAGYCLVTIQLKGHALAAKGTQLSLHSTTSTSAQASLFVMDDVMSFERGVNFGTGGPEGSMTSPSFAQKSLAISAYALHTGSPYAAYPEKAGELRKFSGRGPDLWGNPGIALSAPDNAIVAYPDKYDTTFDGPEGKKVHWSEFGGTSGSSPQVVAALALLKQASPNATPAELRQKLLEGARKDSEVQKGTEAQWGAGKLGLPFQPATGTPPTVTLQAPKSAAPGASVTLEAKVEDDGDLSQAKARWDVGYDGTWDGEFAASMTSTTTMPTNGPLAVKVEVLDATGQVARATALIAQGPAETKDSGVDSPQEASVGKDAASGDSANADVEVEGSSEAVPQSGGDDSGGCGCVAAGKENKGAGVLGLVLLLGALGQLASRRR